MISVKSLDALLRECKRAADVRLQAVLEFFARLFEERLLGAVLYAVDCYLGFQTGEALVRFYVAECLFDGRFGCVGREGFEDRVGTGLPNRGDYGL